MLKEITNALKTVDDCVFFGAAPDPKAKDAPPSWNYIVYRRESRKFTPNQKDPTEYYGIYIFRENFIPEDLPDKVITALDKVPGLKLATSTPGTYRYMLKPNTTVIVEVFGMEYIAARKKQ